jgi:hypothetical protein
MAAKHPEGLNNMSYVYKNGGLNALLSRNVTLKNMTIVQTLDTMP